MRMARCLGPAFAIAGSVVLAGCSGTTLAGSGSPASTALLSSPSSPLPSSPASSPPATSPAPTSSTAPGSATLQAIVLKSGDLPAGWTGTPYRADPNFAATQDALNKCVGGKNTDPDLTGEVHSDYFGSGNAVISSAASRYRSEADIRADTATLRNPKLPGCYRTLLRQQLASGLPGGGRVDTVSITITPAPAGYPRNVVGIISGRIGVIASGIPISVFIDAAYVTGRLVEAEVDFENVGATVPPALRKQLITLVATRAGRI